MQLLSVGVDDGLYSKRECQLSMKIQELVQTIITAVLLLLFSGLNSCADLVDPSGSASNVICYEKSYNGRWEIFTNNIAGNRPHNVSNCSDDDEYPQWSPNGRYIVYSRAISVNGPLVIVYDTQNQSSINLTSDGGGAGLTPQWAPNGRVYFGYPYSQARYRGTYLMNPDGSDKKKILDLTATIYFYLDSYTFLYIDGTKVYKTNIDGGFNEFVLDLKPTSDQFFTIRDFNPAAGRLLVNTNTIPGSSSAIAEFNVETMRINTLVVADTGYTLYLQKYSRDFSKVAFIEHSSKDEFLSVLQNGVKKRLMRIPANTPPVSFSYNPMQFSPDGRRIAFSKQVFGDGQWISWTEYLYTVDISTGAVQYIDEGFYPSWNPLP